MYQAIIVVHVLLGLGVIGFVLIQQGKGADAGAAFGSSSGTVFGAQGASSFLSRTTAILAALFFATSLGLAVMSGNLEGETDLMDASEEAFADVPLVNGAGSQPVVDTLPVIKEELPAEAIKIQDEISSMADTVKAKAIEVTEELPAEVIKIQEEISSMADTIKTEAVENTEELGSAIEQQ
jgi:preprotein translocase subunit SecG